MEIGEGARGGELSDGRRDVGWRVQVRDDQAVLRRWQRSVDQAHCKVLQWVAASPQAEDVDSAALRAAEELFATLAERTAKKFIFLRIGPRPEPPRTAPRTAGPELCPEPPITAS